MTKVVVSKIIQGKIGESKLETIIKIKTPKLVSLDFVLALDSSGSMGEGGDPELGKIIKEVIPDVLRSINTENKKINVSTILWNKGIDNIPRFLDIYNSSLDFNNLPFNPTEDKESNLDVGVNKSVKFLNDNKPNNLVKTRRFIIFVTSRSEFENYTNDSLRIAKKSSYVIYPVGLNLYENSELTNSLKYMAKYTGGRFIWTPGTQTWTKDEIKNILVEQINYAINDIILNNTIISDSVYPYLNIDNKSLKVKVDGTIVNNAIDFERYKINPDDGTKNIIVKISKGLKPDSTMEISFDTEINLDIPVYVANDKRELNFTINKDTSASQLSFKWHNGQIFNVSLPKNNIHISSSIEQGRGTGIMSGIIGIMDYILSQVQ
ncbi:MAG: VWA domain-containing protein [Methanotrichaceae archaeon]